MEENLATIGITGRRSINKRIGDKRNFIKIPSEVGEIDFLGYSAKENFLVEWLLNNHSAVIIALNSMGIYPESIQPTKIVAAFITYYPCVSITNLILDYHEKGKWSYSKGIFNSA